MNVSRATSWQLRVTPDGVIHAKFVGPTRSDEIAPFIAALVALMPAAQARLIFDLRELEGYNAETKGPMKAWLLKHKLAIGELTVIVAKSRTILKMVVAAMSLATGVKISIRDVEEAPSLAAP
jgi:predicted lysophospholipase L1 biosynthesis ABC-type transport system permease subunit